ncbi:hypothetical protein [Longispora albida]|uniref:hypothetical protein n=1 Tax=Longispora albida TaxID=203523 RepID=UPI00035CC514|nr:hypothetical protein [Longispora albida]
MGYTGHIITAKSARPLTDAAALSQYGSEILDVAGVPGGWQRCSIAGAFPDDMDKTAEALAAETDGPVIAATFLDSDCAMVSAAMPGSANSWNTYIHPDTALSFGAPPLPHTITQIADMASAWASASGLDPDHEAICELLEAHGTFAEDIFSELLIALGITEPAS